MEVKTVSVLRYLVTLVSHLTSATRSSLHLPVLDISPPQSNNFVSSPHPSCPAHSKLFRLCDGIHNLAVRSADESRCLF